MQVRTFSKLGFCSRWPRMAFLMVVFFPISSTPRPRREARICCICFEPTLSTFTRKKRGYSSRRDCRKRKQDQSVIVPFQSYWGVKLWAGGRSEGRQLVAIHTNQSELARSIHFFHHSQPHQQAMLMACYCESLYQKLDKVVGLPSCPVFPAHLQGESRIATKGLKTGPALRKTL